MVCAHLKPLSSFQFFEIAVFWSSNRTLWNLILIFCPSELCPSTMCGRGSPNWIPVVLHVVSQHLNKHTCLIQYVAGNFEFLRVRYVRQPNPFSLCSRGALLQFMVEHGRTLLQDSCCWLVLRTVRMGLVNQQPEPRCVSKVWKCGSLSVFYWTLYKYAAVNHIWSICPSTRPCRR